MAKSLRSTTRKRNRAAMRATVGARDEAKVLRKVVRKTVTRVLAAGGGGSGGGGESEASLRALLGGVGGASAHLVTAAPTQRRKLPFTFNPALRERRLAEGLEDDTDDEALDAGAVNEKGEPLRGEPVPTGAASVLAAAAHGGGGGGGGGGTGDEGMAAERAAAGAEEEEGGEAAAVRRLLVQQSGRKRASTKPVGKRDMSASYHDWENKDLVNPAVPGFFYEELPKGARRARKDARGAGKKKWLQKAGPIPVAR
jgi:hypothetical protein